MNTFKLRNVSVAAVLAGAAAVLVAVYVTSYRDRVQSGADLVNVFVAARDIAEDTDGAQVASGGYLKQQKVLRRSVVPGAISSPTQIENRVAAQEVFAGEQVTARQFRPLAQQGIQAKLSGNLRGFIVPGEAGQLLAGKLKAGDHVDVVANIKFKVKTGLGTAGNERTRSTTRVVLRDLLVLEPPASPGSEGLATGANAYSTMLAVTDSQVQKLFFAMKNAEWSLALRPVAKPQDSPESVETIESMTTDGLKLRQILQLLGRIVTAGDQKVSVSNGQ